MKLQLNISNNSGENDRNINSQNEIKMIQSIHIQNFQSHKNTSLEFDRGVNVIVGTSDSGKSSILRAIRWLLTNRPSGDSFRSIWGGDTKVEIEIGDNIIVREKGKENSYVLNDIPFKAISTDVPDEIKKVLNCVEINTQWQHDSPFLLSNTSGEVAQHFNKVAHLENIDKALLKINSEVRSLEQDLKNKKEALEKQEEQLKEFDYLSKMEAEVEVLEKLDAHFVRTVSQMHLLQEVISNIETTDEDIASELKLLKFENIVENIYNLINQKNEKEKELKSIKLLAGAISFTIEAIDKNNGLLQLEPAVKQTQILIDKKEEISLKLGDLGSDIVELEQLIQNIEVTNSELENLQKTFQKEMGTTCPLCGQKIVKNN